MDSKDDRPAEIAGLPNVDKIQPANMRVTFGEALHRLEGIIFAALEWQTREKRPHDPMNPAGPEREQLKGWYSTTVATIGEIFVSTAPVLHLLTSQPDSSLSIPVKNLEMQHRHACRAVLEIREEIVQQRERVSVALSDFAAKISHDQKLLELGRQIQATATDHGERIAKLGSAVSDTNAMTEELWLKLIGEPLVTPPMMRLLGLGITQKALLKVAELVITHGGSALLPG
ncbi:MAG: hypothetical protein QM723_05265 [Myxococcaceae bacterium]